MNTQNTTGCGSGHCGCASGQAGLVDVATINGVALHTSGEALAPDELLERAHGELLRQEAVRLGLLQAQEHTLAPELGAHECEVIESMLDTQVLTPEPSEAECLRYYEGHKTHFVVGQAMHVRHILFAVTPGVDVHALAKRAEQALLELSRKDVPEGRFEALARELSNCPTGATGGDLGWIGPQDCAPELANELFFQTDSGWGMGLHPRLVHTRHGFHIIEVLGRRRGKQLGFDEVKDRIAQQLAMQVRATALRQYMLVLAGRAKVEGLELEGADTPLVQ